MARHQLQTTKRTFSTLRWPGVSRIPIYYIHTFFIVQLILLTSSSTTQARVFGTLNGYDSGGKDPVCWESVYDGTIADQMSRDDIGQLNQFVKNDTTGFAAPMLLPACYSGIEFSVEQLENYKTIYSGEDFKLQFRFQTSFSQLEKRLAIQQPRGNVTLWVRLLECNARAIGFCNPFVDSNAWDTTFVSGSAEYSEGGSSSIMSGDETQNSFTSKWVRVKELTNSVDDDSFEGTLNLTVRVPRSVEGLYFFAGHAVMLVQTNESVAYRVDVANALPDSPMTMQAPPEVVYVSKQTQIVIGVIVSVCSLISLVMFGFIVKFRNHRVMTLAQGGLLGWLQACSFFTIGLSILFLPTRDIFCQLNSLALIPCTMMANIMVGRLWRIYTTLTVANKLGRQYSSSAETNRGAARRTSIISEQRLMNGLGNIAFSRLLRKKGARQLTRQSINLRQATTCSETVRLILILSLPQTILQIFDVAYYSSESVIETTEDGTYGRQVCSDDGFRWIKYTGVILLALHYVLTLYVAWCSRDLPTAFNEKVQIFRASLINGVVSVVVIGLLTVFDLPTTSPNVSTLLQVILVLTLAMVSNWYIVVPKIRRILSGEKVVVSDMLRGITAPTWKGPQDTANNHANNVNTIQPNASAPSTNAVREQSAAVEGGVAPNSNSSVVGGESQKIVLKEYDAMPTAVERELYRLDQVINTVTNKCLSGRSIDSSEWRTLKESVATVSAEVNRIEFDWSDGNSSQEGALEDVSNGVTHGDRLTTESEGDVDEKT